MSNVTENYIPYDKNKQKKRLEEEINRMKEEYCSLLRELSLYASNGDLSENADWMSVNERKENLYNEIVRKEACLAELHNNNIKIQKITYLILKTQEKKTVFLSEGETNPVSGHISPRSSLGMILANSEEGNVNWVVCDQENSYQIKILSKEWLI